MKINRQYYLILLVILLLPLLVNAEYDSGLKGGFNFTRIIDDEIYEFNSSTQIGIGFGKYFKKPYKSGSILQAEILLNYNSASLKYDYSLFDREVEFSEKFHLLSIETPLIIKLPFPSRSNSQLSIYTGADLIFNLYAHRKGNYVDPNSSTPKTDFGGRLSNVSYFNYGIIVGTEYLFDVKNSKIGIDFRVIHLFNNLFRHVDDPNDIGDSLPFSEAGTGRAFDFSNNRISLQIIYRKGGE